MSKFFENLGNALIPSLLVIVIFYHLGFLADIERMAKETNMLLERNNKLLEQIEIRLANIQNKI